MFITIPLRSGTSLANVRYRFIVGGLEQPEQSAGISQPDSNFPFFVFSIDVPDGTDEVIAYDITDLGNWNVAQYKLLLTQQAAQGLTPVTIPPALTSNTLVPFRQVYESIVRRMGFNPRAHGEPKEDVAHNVLVHINDRTKFIWSAWDWPLLNLVEWRAFRTVWVTAPFEFHAGDQLYYFGDGVVVPARNVDFPTPGTNAGYYVCKTDAPPGTLPTNTNFFSPLTLVDQYIAYQQTNENAIGEMLDVYRDNPREKRWTPILKSAPSSRGIDVRTSINIVWIRYRIPCSQFTIDPFMDGYTMIGDPYYDPKTGDCFIYTGGSSGTLIPMPRFLAGYVKPAAYADAILETTIEATVRMQLSAAAREEALEYLQREIDNLVVQGQQIFYPAFPSRRRHHHVRQGYGAVPLEVFGGFS